MITILISFITLIFGELVPKRIALQKAESYSMFCAKPILVISKIASAFTKVLSWSTKFILRIFGMADENVEESLSREEIRSMVESGQENGVFNEIETDMITNIFEFDDSLALNVMTPRTDVYCIDINDALSDNIDQMMTMQYTRIPVYDDSIDNIIGILNMKDFAIEARKVGFDNYIVDGNYLLDDLDDELDLKLSNNNHDTIGGFVLHLLGEIPEENQQRTVKYENLTFLIISVKGNRVTKIKLTINEKEKEPDFSED